MKKRFLAGILTAVLGVLAVAPVTGFAAELDTLGDVNKDGVVNISDYTLLKLAVQQKVFIENGKLTDEIIGDLNGDRVVDKEDLDVFDVYLTQDLYAADADFNADRKVDISDRTRLKHAIQVTGQIMSDGTVQDYVTGDMDENGRLNTEDLFILGRYIK